MAAEGPYLKPINLDYACKCFFNNSARVVPPNASSILAVLFGGSVGNVPGVSAPREPGSPVDDYFAVVSLATGLRVAPRNSTGVSCPRQIDPLQSVVHDPSSPTGFFCACPDPSEMNVSNILTIPMVGIGIAILGAVLSSLGQVTMKWVHTHNELRPLRELGGVYFSTPSGMQHLLRILYRRS